MVRGAPRYIPQLVKVSVEANKTNAGRIYYEGSGVLVGKTDKVGYILTAYHNISERTSKPIITFLKSGDRYYANVKEVDRTNDMATLIIRRPKEKPVKISQGKLKPGDKLYRYGWQTYSAGQFLTTASTVGENSQDNVIKYGTYSRVGDSGSPVFNEKGELVTIHILGGGKERAGTVYQQRRYSHCIPIYPVRFVWGVAPRPAPVRRFLWWLLPGRKAYPPRVDRRFANGTLPPRAYNGYVYAPTGNAVPTPTFVASNPPRMVPVRPKPTRPSPIQAPQDEPMGDDGYTYPAPSEPHPRPIQSFPPKECVTAEEIALKITDDVALIVEKNLEPRLRAQLNGVESRLERSLLVQMQSDPLFRGPPGPIGPIGPEGPQGKTGETGGKGADGKPGDSPTIDIDMLAGKIAEKQQGVFVKLTERIDKLEAKIPVAYDVVEIKD